MACERAPVPMFKHASGGEDERIFLVGHLYGRYVLDVIEFAPAAREAFGEEIRRAGMVVFPYGGLEAYPIDAPIFHAGIFTQHATHLFEHFGGRLVCPESRLLPAKLLFDVLGKITDDFPIGSRLPARFQRLAHALNAAVGISEGAFLFRPGSGGEKEKKQVARVLG